jgi:lysophospholipase L1-like esterase
MKDAVTIIAMGLMFASLSEGAFAQTATTLTHEDAQGYFWDVGDSQRGETLLQLDQAFLPNEYTQAFTWTPVSGGFTICSLNVCLSDSGQGSVLMSDKADVFTITAQNAVLDVTTGLYVGEPANLDNGSYAVMGTTPVAWNNAPSGSGIDTTGAIRGPIKIMPLGDSITQGSAVSATFADGGYRCPLYFLLQQGNVQFSYAGDSDSLEPGTVTACPDVSWEGHGGYDTASIQGWADADASIETSLPDIVLLLAGTNDIGQDEASTVSAHLTNLLNDIYAKDPNAWVIVSTIPPFNPTAPDALPNVGPWAPQVPGVNDQIRATVAQFPRTSLVDFYTAAAGNLTANIGSDGIHPTVTGYGLLAKLWYDAIAAHLAGPQLEAVRRR